MARLYSNFIEGVTSANMTAGSTTIQGAFLAALPVVTSDILVLVIDPEAAGNGPEIVHVTAHTASSTSASVLRGQEGTSAAAHTAPTKVVGPLTAAGIEAILTGIANSDAAIAANAAAIATNTGNINSNDSDISALQGTVSGHTSSIATNTGDIATNASNIGTNTSNIGSLQSTVSSHTSTLGTHTSNIGTLNTNIAKIGVGESVKLTSNPSVAGDSAWHYITWHAVEQQGSYDFWTVANPTRLTVPAAGWYLIRLQVFWSSTGTPSGSYRRINILQNGTPIAYDYRAKAPEMIQSVSAIRYMTTGQYVEGQVRLDGGTSHPISASGTAMEIARLSLNL